MSQRFQTRKTGDGSYTLYDAESDECFHSHKGALTESEYVFLNAAKVEQYLQHARTNEESLKIVEMGLGTGLNYLLSARAALQQNVALHYHALEIKLLHSEALASLHYDEILGLHELATEFVALIDKYQNLPDGVHRFDTSAGSLTIHLGDALQVTLPNQYYSICYFDAFSPGSAPLLWQPSQLKKFYEALKMDGTWVSYCARGAVRRDLQEIGFEIDRLPGPPGKREMLRAFRRRSRKTS